MRNAFIVMAMLACLTVNGQTTNRLVPVMSSATNGEYIVSHFVPEGGAVWSYDDNWKAFDRQSATRFYVRKDYVYHGLGGLWLKIDFGSQPTNVTAYRVYFQSDWPTNSMYNSWSLQGSTNDSNWVDLDSRNNYSFPNVSAGKTAVSGNSFTNYFPIAEDKIATYRYVRFILTGLPAGDYNVFSLYELELYNVYTPPPPPPACAVLGSSASTGVSTISGAETGITVLQ